MVPLLLFVPRQLWLLPRKAAAAQSDNSGSLSDAEGAHQLQQDKKAKDIYNCVIKQLLCLPGILAAGQAAPVSAGNGKGESAEGSSGAVGGHSALHRGHLNQEVPQKPALASARGEVPALQRAQQLGPPAASTGVRDGVRDGAGPQ